MAFNRNIYNTRYQIEQKSLPVQFYDTPKDVIQSILDPGNNTFFKLYKTLIERTGEEFPYTEEDFTTKCFKFEDGTLGCFVTLPKPESVMLCSNLVYVFAPDLKKLMYFTIETDEFIGRMSYKICSVSSEGKHIVYGGCSGNSSDIVLKIKEIYSRL